MTFAPDFLKNCTVLSNVSLVKYGSAEPWYMNICFYSREAYLSNLCGGIIPERMPAAENVSGSIDIMFADQIAPVEKPDTVLSVILSLG